MSEQEGRFSWIERYEREVNEEVNRFRDTLPAEVASTLRVRIEPSVTVHATWIQDERLCTTSSQRVERATSEVRKKPKIIGRALVRGVYYRIASYNHSLRRRLYYQQTRAIHAEQLNAETEQTPLGEQLRTQTARIRGVRTWYYPSNDPADIAQYCERMSEPPTELERRMHPSISRQLARLLETNVNLPPVPPYERPTYNPGRIAARAPRVIVEDVPDDDD